jgi:hypothetical protein
MGACMMARVQSTRRTLYTLRLDHGGAKIRARLGAPRYLCTARLWSPAGDPVGLPYPHIGGPIGDPP